MKKILLFAVALALPLLFSCNKDKNNDPGSASIPSGASFNNSVTFENDDMWITFNGDNNYVGGKKTTKVEFVWEVMWGKYTYANNIYTLYLGTSESPIGTITDLGNGKVHVKIEAMDMDVDVNVTRPAAGNDSQRAANHTWKPVSLTLIYGALTFNSSNGVDLNEFESWAVQNKILENTTFKKNMVMQNVFISDSKLGIVFANGDTYVAKFDSKADLANFTLSQVDIKNATGNFSIFEGNASVSFSNGQCVVEIKGRYQDNSATAILTLAL